MLAHLFSDAEVSAGSSLFSFAIQFLFRGDRLRGQEMSILPLYRSSPTNKLAKTDSASQTPSSTVG